MDGSSDGGFRDKGLRAFRDAVAFDDDGKWEQAVQKYTTGLECFMLSMKYEKDERKKAMVRQKTSEYMTRCETLKRLLDEGKCPPPKVAAPAASGAAQGKKSGGQKGGGGADSEADKMKQTLMESVQMESPDVRPPPAHTQVHEQSQSQSQSTRVHLQRQRS